MPRVVSTRSERDGSRRKRTENLNTKSSHQTGQDDVDKSHCLDCKRLFNTIYGTICHPCSSFPVMISFPSHERHFLLKLGITVFHMLQSFTPYPLLHTNVHFECPDPLSPQKHCSFLEHLTSVRLSHHGYNSPHPPFPLHSQLPLNNPQST